MSKVIFKKGLLANLPSSAEDNVLLFATDVGRLFQGNGIGKKLTEYSDLITGYVNLEELKTANPRIEHKLYITDDDNIYIYKNGDYAKFGGHNHSNYDVLGKLSEDENGNLLYDGKLIEGTGTGDGFSSSLKKIKLTVETDGQTEFTTELSPETSIDKMDFYFVIGNNIYIDEISISLNGDRKVVVTYDNTGFDLETTDSVYLLYSEEIESSGSIDIEFATDTDIDNMFS